MKPALAAAVLDALNIAVAERLTDGGFAIVGSVPSWFHGIWTPLSQPDLDALETRSPFLANFLIDATECWTAGTPPRLPSGPWIETGPDGDPMALEATALNLGQRKALLVTRLGRAYEHARATLQSAREFNLANERLEALVQQRTATIREREEEIVMRLVTAAEHRDQDTGAHVRRIGELSAMLADAIGYTEHTADLPLAAAMHDLGKIGIPDDILHKPGRLTTEEYQVMQTHTVIGAQILEGSDASVLQLARTIALSHHERWNGAGYPAGLAGDEIPLCGRIVMVADCYDALVTDRVYRRAMSRRDALAWMVSERNKHFDRHVLDAFLTLEPTLPDLYQRYRPSNRS